jgi:phage shock protein A
VPGISEQNFIFVPPGIVMNYFSRLTDIVTCNLSSILKESADPRATLEQIIREMQDGVAGAQRSAATAARNLEKVETEIAEQKAQVESWMETARKRLSENEEGKARQALMRKKEVEALIAGLEQQRHAARTTRDHLQTTLAALQARLHDAERRLQGQPAQGEPAGAATRRVSETAASKDQLAEIDRELADLRRELGQS